MARIAFTQAAPHLATLLKRRLPKVPGNARVFRYFKKYAQLDDKGARKALSLNSNPDIILKNLPPGVYGNYPGIGQEIQFSETINSQYESIIFMAKNSGRHTERWRKLIARAELIIEAIVLHEMVHWGDKNADAETLDGYAVSKGWKDWGHKFVRAAYGKLFTYKSGFNKHGHKVKVPNTDIAGWLGWYEVLYEGKEYSITNEPEPTFGLRAVPPQLSAIR